MKIIISKEIGFCFGVKKALESVRKNLKDMPKPVRMYGFLIHNEEVVKELCRLGIEIIDSLEGVSKGTLIITAHGISPKIKSMLQERTSLTILDTTCPKVSAIHRIVQKLNKEGKTIIIFGDSEHQEVKGIKGAAGKDSIVISSLEDFLKLKIDKNKRYSLVVQTTQDIEVFEKISSFLKENFPEIEIINTICDTTYKRQAEIKEIAPKSDLVLIIGSKRSANTRRLYETSLAINKNTYHISGASSLKREWFLNKKSVGIGAGASTPDSIIKEVVGKVKEYEKKD